MQGTHSRQPGREEGKVLCKTHVLGEGEHRGETSRRNLKAGGGGNAKGG